jgi:hypothetical protein
MFAFTPDCHPSPHWSVQVPLGPTDSYVTSEPFAGGLFITLMMEAVRTSGTSVYSNETTRRDIPESSHLHTGRRENLKSQTGTWLIRQCRNRFMKH